MSNYKNTADLMEAGFREAVKVAYEQGLAEGERRGREAERAENKLHFCGGCGAEIDPSVCWCGSTGCLEMYDGHPFVPMGCNCLREERHQTILAHKAKVAALRWFHDEVVSVLLRGLNLRRILDLRTDPNYGPIAASKEPK